MSIYFDMMLGFLVAGILFVVIYRTWRALFVTTECADNVDVSELNNCKIHIIGFDSPIWLRVFKSFLRILIGMYFRAGAKVMLLCERMQQPELSRKSDFGYIAKVFWQIDDVRQFFQDGLPVGNTRGRLYRGFWPLRMRHMGLFKVHSANFSSGLLQRDTTPALMETAGTEKYIVMFRKDNEFARVSGNRVSDIAEEFKRNCKCQGYVVYNVLKESGPNIENYCEWIIEIYFDEYGLSETTDKMAYIADVVDNDGYEVIYAGYKDTECFPLLSTREKIPTTTSNNTKESRKTK